MATAGNTPDQSPVTCAIHGLTIAVPIAAIEKSAA